MRKIMKSKKRQAASSSKAKGENDFVYTAFPTLHPRHCVLCGGPPNVIGIYEPGDPKIRLHENGKVRRFIYALCEGCFGRPDTPDRVEKVIHAELNGISNETMFKEDQLH